MNEKQINKLYFGDVDRPVRSMDRRNFIKKLGGGLIIVFSLSTQAFKSRSEDDHDKRSDEELDLNAYLRIKEDGTVDCYTGKIEMGQGIITSLAQVLSEELEVPMNTINMVMGDTDLCPYDAGTWGSLTTRFFDPLLRAAAVEAKGELLKMGAAKLRCQESELLNKGGFVISKTNSAQRVSYAELTKGEKIVKTISSPPILKKAKDFKTIGQPIISTDAIKKVSGQAIYTSDIQLPGMLYAYIKRPPAHGAQLKSVDITRAKTLKGITIINEDGLIAALHEDLLMAEEAMVKIKAEWDIPAAKADSESIFDHILTTATNSRTTEEKGDLSIGFEQSEQIIEATYLDGYKAHASIETHAATAQFEGDKLVMWASTQTPFGTREAVANALNMPIDKVHIKQVFIGGGFGGKIYNQQAIECAKLTKISGKPVQVAWSRREEFMYDCFRPAAVIKVKAGLQGGGKLKAWSFDVYCAGPRGTQDFYNVPNVKTQIFRGKEVHPFATGAWRAPGNNTTTFARESHIDVLAHSIGMDPIEFRLLNAEDLKIKRTIKLATDTFGYKKAQTGTNRGCGMAIGTDAGTIVVLIAEVEVNPATGVVTPLRMVCAQDMGQVVNPHGAIVQTEGGLTMGLGYALYEDVEFNWGTVETQNFDSYEITKMAVTPPIECVFADDMDSPPQGGGEPAIVTVGGAIANAVFHACGARVKQMPVTPQRILEALR
ncbi:xanthine dehydrogenase family protein molybdopterin-binding subunit [Carboxylicivirga marina]|uniref:Xanthine dehydrogenase family protein molybdopterin-binding subunit n=1 Tax=Carboxylicivirga marina TaxID=2800988 RepID=A0ABS1HMU1_9BACT|nr:molybdopterin cofactor-binding domain-containing protein [Carboxylicivirga marina]MBK3518872.1 xanthine dehydrogenase family protein molybdopterin-binding subunit [Carboxylicivirga marina]